MSTLSVATSYLGLFVLAARLLPTMRGNRDAVARDSSSDNSASADKVSVVIPARNEEATLPPLLESLLKSTYQNLEIIVVNDASRDRTAEIASHFASRDSRVRLVNAAQRPIGWAGKNWACSQGAQECSGEWILFTDADTQHEKNGITRALGRMRRDSLDLLSAVPYHICHSLWEKLTGPFHIMVFISSSAFSKPTKRSLFAIGQFLFFKRSSYLTQGGHFAIRSSLADDLELAQTCLKLGGRYAVDTSAELYRVHMYATFKSFLAGWRRIFRLGFPYANAWRVAEIYFVIACLTMSFQFGSASPPEALASLLGVLILLLTQKRFGAFSAIGAIAAPFGLALFTYTSVFSFFDLILKRDLLWRGRRYKGAHKPD